MDLKTWIRLRSFSQKDLAEELGVSRSYVSELLKGKRKFNPGLAQRIERITKSEVSRMDLLYPEQGFQQEKHPEYIEPGFLERGSPLTPEIRERVLKGALQG